MAVFTEAERVEVWDRHQAGELNRSIGRSLGRTGASIRAMIESTGGGEAASSAAFGSASDACGARGDLSGCRRRRFVAGDGSQAWPGTVYGVTRGGS